MPDMPTVLSALCTFESESGSGMWIAGSALKPSSTHGADGLFGADAQGLLEAADDLAGVEAGAKAAAAAAVPGQAAQGIRQAVGIARGQAVEQAVGRGRSPGCNQGGGKAGKHKASLHRRPPSVSFKRSAG